MTIEIEESEESWQASEALLRPRTNPIIETPTALARVEAEVVREQIETLTGEIAGQMQSLEANWVRLGVLAAIVRQKKFWLDYGFDNYGSFIDDIAAKVNRTRSYIYLCRGVAETLLPQLPAASLTEMGIAKAFELKRLAASNGTGTVPQDLIDLALDRKIDTEEVRARVQTILNPQAQERGRWRDFGGFYVDDSERLALDYAYELALKTDPVVPVDLPDHVQRKEVVLRWCAEYVSTYGGPK